MPCSVKYGETKEARMLRLFGNVLLSASILFAGIWVWYYLIEYQEYDEFTIATPLLILLIGFVLRFIFAGPERL
jgi:hypothetical protein